MKIKTKNFTYIFMYNKLRIMTSKKYWGEHNKCVGDWYYKQLFTLNFKLK